MKVWSNLNGTSGSSFTIGNKASVLSSSGIPSNSLGENGDICMVETGALLLKEDGVWVKLSSGHVRVEVPMGEDFVFDGSPTYIAITSGSGTTTVDAPVIIGHYLTVKNETNSSSPITISSDDGIDGSSSYTIDRPYGSIRMLGQSMGWVIISEV